jgi:two-component system phosphate regulon response regulator OmpR
MSEGNDPAGAPGAVADDAPHILVVDDDQRIRDLLARFLQDNGYRVSTAEDAGTARASMRGLSFDLIILDIMMPGETGLSLATDLRGRSQVPILMLTARTEPEDRIAGLEIGADDYLTKPFEPRELLLRMKNILNRRVEVATGPDQVTFGQFVVRRKAGVVHGQQQALDSQRLQRRPHQTPTAVPLRAHPPYVTVLQPRRQGPSRLVVN